MDCRTLPFHLPFHCTLHTGLDTVCCTLGNRHYLRLPGAVVASDTDAVTRYHHEALRPHRGIFAARLPSIILPHTFPTTPWRSHYPYNSYFVAIPCSGLFACEPLRAYRVARTLWIFLDIMHSLSLHCCAGRCRCFRLLRLSPD